MERRKQWYRSLVFILFLLFSLWVLLQFLAPFLLPSGSVPDLTGVVGLSDNEQVIQHMPIPWNGIYTSGDRLCHQIADRSLFFNGNQMPFCARCTGIWLGMALGLGLMVMYRIELDEKYLVVLLLGLIPLGIDGGGQLLGLWESDNSVRLLTGLLAGGMTGATIGVIIDELAEIKKKKKSRNERS